MASGSVPRSCSCRRRNGCGRRRRAGPVGEREAEGHEQRSRDPQHQRTSRSKRSTNAPAVSSRAGTEDRPTSLKRPSGAVSAQSAAVERESIDEARCDREPGRRTRPTPSSYTRTTRRRADRAAPRAALRELRVARESPRPRRVPGQVRCRSLFRVPEDDDLTPDAVGAPRGRARSCSRRGRHATEVTGVQ